MTVINVKISDNQEKLFVTSELTLCDGEFEEFYLVDARLKDLVGFLKEYFNDELSDILAREIFIETGRSEN